MLREDPDNSITIAITIDTIIIIIISIIITIINKFLIELFIRVNEPKVRGDLNRHCRGRKGEGATELRGRA